MDSEPDNDSPMKQYTRNEEELQQSEPQGSQTACEEEDTVQKEHKKKSAAAAVPGRRRNACRPQQAGAKQKGKPVKSVAKSKSPKPKKPKNPLKEQRDRKRKNDKKPKKHGNGAKRVRYNRSVPEKTNEAANNMAEDQAASVVGANCGEFPPKEANLNNSEGQLISKRREQTINEVKNKISQLRDDFINPDYNADYGKRSETILSSDIGTQDTAFVTGNVERVIEMSGTTVVSTLECSVEKENENISKTIIRTVSFYGDPIASRSIENTMVAQEDRNTNDLVLMPNGESRISFATLQTTTTNITHIEGSNDSCPTVAAAALSPQPNTQPVPPPGTNILPVATENNAKDDFYKGCMIM